MQPKNTLLALLALLFICASNTLLAGDIANDVRQGRTHASGADGGYLDLGLAFVVYKSPVKGLYESEKGGGLGFTINGYYEKNGFFIETQAESESGIGLGYNFFSRHDKQFALLFSSKNGEISDDFDDDLEGLRDRKGDFLSGIRSTFYRRNLIAQLELQADFFGVHEGFMLSSSLGKFWQVRNWNFHSILKLNHRSRKLTDYYVGIRNDEANEKFKPYKAGPSNEWGLELGVTYPLNEKWVFRSTAEYIYVDSAIANSPLAFSHNGAGWLTSINRVF
jgi:outer membrane scaffolding protein for murein synthesis (MipA/OmpV family)